MDGGLLMPDRFDIGADGSRLGFEDIPSLLGMQVRDKLDERKYHGSYELNFSTLAGEHAESIDRKNLSCKPRTPWQPPCPSFDTMSACRKT